MANVDHWIADSGRLTMLHMRLSKLQVTRETLRGLRSRLVSLPNSPQRDALLRVNAQSIVAVDEARAICLLELRAAQTISDFAGDPSLE